MDIRQCTATNVIKPKVVKETQQWRSERLAQVQSFVNQTELTSELNVQCNYFTLVEWQNWAHDQLSALWHNTRKKHTSHKSNPCIPQSSPMPNFIIIHNVYTWNANCSLWNRNVMHKDFATTVRRHRYTNTYQTQYLMRMLDWWKKSYSLAIYWQPETSVLDNIHNFFLA